MHFLGAACICCEGWGPTSRAAGQPVVRRREATYRGGRHGTEKARTLAEKVWDDHVVVKGEGQDPDLIYINLHLVHEVTSPQAFDELRLAGRPLRRPT